MTKERKYFEEVMIEKHGSGIDFTRENGKYKNKSIEEQFVAYLLYRLNNPQQFKG